MTAAEIELSLASAYPASRWITVARVGWARGIGFDETDFLAVSERGYCHTVEIKISISDLKREWDKTKHQPEHSGSWERRQGKWIKYQWFAVPEEMLEKASPLIPMRYGVFSVSRRGLPDRTWSYAEPVRIAPPNKAALPWPHEKRLHLLRNISMKYWALRRDVSAAARPGA